MYSKPILKLRLLLPAILFCCLLACSKSNNNNNQNNGSSGTLKATVDGTSWQASYVYAVDSTSAHLIVFVGSDNSQANTLAIALPDSIPTGTYSLNIASSILLEYVVKGSGTTATYLADPTVGGSGTITISSFNKSAKQISGTFSGVAKNVTNDGTSKNITSGSFSITYH